MPHEHLRAMPYGRVEATLTMKRDASNQVMRNGLPSGTAGYARLSADFRAEILGGGSLGLRLTCPKR